MDTGISMWNEIKVKHQMNLKWESAKMQRNLLFRLNGYYAAATAKTTRKKNEVGLKIWT